MQHCPTLESVRGRRAFTLVELMIASSVASLIAGSVMLLLIESAKEQRRSLADSTVDQVAGNLGDELMRTLREMSATEGVVFSGTVTSRSGQNLGFSRIIVARGPAPDFPREEIYFTAADGRAVYDPNRSVGGNERILLASRNSAFMLRALAFQPSFKVDGTPDNSLVNVLIDLDDNGVSGRPAATNPAHVQRSFSVKMRNN